MSSNNKKNNERGTIDEIQNVDGKALLLLSIFRDSSDEESKEYIRL